MLSLSNALTKVKHTAQAFAYDPQNEIKPCITIRNTFLGIDKGNGTQSNKEKINGYVYL